MSEKITTISDTLKNFDVLPNHAHVRLDTVKALYACSTASVWRGCKEGRIPSPYKLSSRTTCWNVGELKEALALKNRSQKQDQERG